MARLHLGVKRVTPSGAEVEGGAVTQAGYTTGGGGRPLTDTIFYEKSVRLFAFQFGRSDQGRDIGYDISTRMWASLAIALPVFLLGLVAYITFALLMAFFRATYVDFWGVVACVAMMSISGLFYIIGGQYMVGKLLNLVPISGDDGGADAFKFLGCGLVGSWRNRASTRWYRPFYQEIKKISAPARARESRSCACCSATCLRTR